MAGFLKMNSGCPPAPAADPVLAEDGLYDDPFSEATDDTNWAPDAPEPTSDREVAAYMIVGTPTEVDRFSAMAKIMGECMTPPDEVTEAEAADGREALLNLVEKVTPAEFRFDCVPTRIVDEGEQFDVYIVRGDDGARARFNSRVGQVGGELADLGKPGLQAVAYAERVLDRMVVADEGSAAVPSLVVRLPNAVPGWDLDLDWDCLCRAWDRLVGGVGTIEVRLPAAASPVVEGEQGDPGHKHRSPSDERYRLRHKYGATRSQMEKFGLTAEMAGYISDRVVDELKAGEGIVNAIENAHKQWAAAHEQWEWIDRLNVRAAAEVTVPRLVAAGRPLDEAMFLANMTDDFLETGWTVGEAFGAAEEGWKAKSTGDAQGLRCVRRLVKQSRYLIVPLILDHAREGKDLMAAIDAGIRDWQEASKPKFPSVVPPGFDDLLRLLMKTLDSQPVKVREEDDRADYRPMCSCVNCAEFRQASGD